MSQVAIKVKGDDGLPKEMIIEAEVVGPFAIHESKNWMHCWTLTHIASGFAVETRGDDATACRTGAAMLQELPVDWDFIDPETVLAWDNETTDQIHTIRLGMRLGDLA